MRRIALTLVMLLMGMALVAGGAVSIVGTALLPLDKEVGTHASAAGAVLGIGLMAAAVNPAANIGFVRLGILYGVVVIGFEIAAHFLLGAAFYFGPVFFGLACSALLIAFYPQRAKLVPPATEPAPPPSPAPAPAGTPSKKS